MGHKREGNGSRTVNCAEMHRARHRSSAGEWWLEDDAGSPAPVRGPIFLR